MQPLARRKTLQRPAHPPLPEASEDATPFKRFGITMLLALGLAGGFKATPVLDWSPIDPVVVASLMVAFAVTVVLYSRKVSVPPGVNRIALLWVAFIPGAAIALTVGEGLAKTAQLFSITLLAAVAGAILLNSSASYRWWIGGQFIFALVTAILVYLLPNISANEAGEATIQGSSTIAAGRTIGAGALIVGLYIVLERRHRVIGIACFGFLFGYLLLVGNRASLIALLGSVLGVCLFAEKFRSSLRRTFISLALLVAVPLALTISGRLSMASRIASLFDEKSAGSTSNWVREQLLKVAVDSVFLRPGGVGWDGFKIIPEMSAGLGTYPHNIVLEIFVDGGWVAGLSFLIFLLVAFRRLAQYSRGTAGTMLLALAFYWFGVALFSEDVNGNRMMWISLGLAFSSAMYRAYNTEQDPNLRRLPIYHQKTL